MSGACSMHGELNAYRILVGKPDGNDHSGDLFVGGG
jgi:hypothetical protein